MQPELVGWMQKVFMGTSPAPMGATAPILGASPSTHGAGAALGAYTTPLRAVPTAA